MSLVLSIIIGFVVVVFAVMALAPLLLSAVPPPRETTPMLRVIEGGKSDHYQDAA